MPLKRGIVTTRYCVLSTVKHGIDPIHSEEHKCQLAYSLKQNLFDGKKRRISIYTEEIPKVFYLYFVEFYVRDAYHYMDTQKPLSYNTQIRS